MPQALEYLRLKNGSDNSVARAPSDKRALHLPPGRGSAEGIIALRFRWRKESMSRAFRAASTCALWAPAIELSREHGGMRLNSRHQQRSFTRRAQGKFCSSPAVRGELSLPFGKAYGGGVPYGTQSIVSLGLLTPSPAV